MHVRYQALSLETDVANKADVSRCKRRRQNLPSIKTLLVERFVIDSRMAGLAEAFDKADGQNLCEDCSRPHVGNPALSHKAR